MPQIFDLSLTSGAKIAVWEVTEPPSFFLDKLDNDLFNIEELAYIPHPQKRLEWLASRYLVQRLSNLLSISHNGMVKDQFGKPYLSKSTVEISVSHTLQYVAVALHPSQSIGLDLEMPSPKLIKVAHKFLNNSELEHAKNQLETLCVYWASKEALYKYYGKKALSFKDNIHINSFDIKDQYLRANIQSPTLSQTLDLLVHWINGCCLVITI
jgi:phosphopantetheinyl transferase